MADDSITLDDFRQVDWESIINNCERKDCFSYSQVLNEQIQVAKSSGDERARRVFRTLYDITKYQLCPSDALNPFGPLRQVEEFRVAITNDLGSDGIETLCQLVPEIADPELRARAADIVWVVVRDPHSAATAVKGYLESATTLEDPEQWTTCAKRIERALRLSVFMKKDELIEQSIEHIETVLERHKGTDPLFLSAKLMKFLLEFKAGDPDTCIEFAETAARRAESEKNWRRAQRYWELQAIWFERIDKPDEHDAALIRAAETYVSDAQQRASEGNGGGYLAATFHLQSAIEAYRRIGRHKKRIDELHNLLLSFEKESVKRLKPIHFEVPIGDVVEESLGKVSGEKYPDVIFILALMVQSPDVDKLSNQADELIKRYPLSHLFETRITDRDGKAVSRKPPIVSNDPDQSATAKRHEMFFLARQHRAVNVNAVIEPARQQIIREHGVGRHDLLDLVANNPFVPPGREQIFAEGLYSGFRGDYLIATHLLVPQLENSFRYVLDRHDVRTSKLDQFGIQESFTLDDILRLSEFETIFSKAVTFDLLSLLVEKSGPNLRHKLAHGLLEYGEFYSDSAVYFWWLVLKLCCLPLIQLAPTTEEAAENEGG